MSIFVKGMINDTTIHLNMTNAGKPQLYVSLPREVGDYCAN